METLRDSAFGKLVRIFSGRCLFRYPEEIDPAAWKKYSMTERQVKDKETATPADLAEHNSDAFGMYTVMSQVSHTNRQLSIATNTREDSPMEKSTAPIVIDWAMPEDSEVRCPLAYIHSAAHDMMLITSRIRKTGACLRNYTPAA